MKKIFLLITILIASCSESNNKFQLSGETKEFEDGTVLYLENILTEKLMDSSVVQGNSFVFETSLPKSPMQVILRTDDFSHYRFLWLENNSMSFDATQTGFMNAEVKGSVEENLSQELSKATMSMDKKERQLKEQEFVKQHPNSIHSAYVLSVYSKTWGKNKTKELFENFSTENRQNEYGKRITNYLQQNENLKEGDLYIDFEMENINGELIKLSDYEGKLILLEFWSSGCLPCRKENPNLVLTYKKYKPKGFEIFAVSQDTKKERWLQAIEKDKLPWVQVSDLKGADNLASIIYGVHGIPDNFLINENGVIIGRNLRGDQLERRLDRILN